MRTQLFSSDKKIAIVSDGLVVFGGNERTTYFLSNIFPDAPIFTSVYLPEHTFPEFKGKKIITMPFSNRVKNDLQYRRLFPWWYINFSMLDLNGYEVIISLSSYLAKYIHPPKGIPHICLLVNPFRLLWKPDFYKGQNAYFGRFFTALIHILIPIARRVDIRRTRKISHIIANSLNIFRQIQQVYGIESEIIYPPINIDDYSISTTMEDYFLYAGRLVANKRVDLAIKACTKLRKRLIVAGEGIEQSVLEKIGGDQVEFLGRVSENELKHLYSNCRALLYPSDEDFGLVPVEVQASGRPVIAFRSGGAIESVVENRTGVFFDNQEVESICEAINRFEKMSFDSREIRENARRFDKTIFERKIRACIDKYV